MRSCVWFALFRHLAACFFTVSTALFLILQTQQYATLVANGVLQDDCPAFCAPLMDMLNHDPEVSVRVGLTSSASSGQSGSQTASPELKGALGISGDRDVKAGQECFNNYGPRENAQLLFGFGFCLPNNPNDTVRIAETL